MPKMVEVMMYVKEWLRGKDLERKGYQSETVMLGLMWRWSVVVSVTIAVVLVTIVVACNV